MSLEPRSETSVKSIKSPFSISIGNIEINISRRQSARQRTSEDELRERVPKRAHSRLDVILNEGDLTAHQVLQAKKSLALAVRDGEFVRQYTKLDYFAGVVFVSMFAVMLLYCGFAYVVGKSTPVETVQLFVLIFISGAGMGYSARHYIVPQRYAYSAMRTLQRTGRRTD